MPLLPLEPSCFPESLFGDRENIAADGVKWHVLHTLPRQEKCLARQFSERRMPFYLPLVRRRFRIRGRPMTSYLPLFPSYIFLLGDGEQRMQAMSTRRVARCLDVYNQEELWHDLRQLEHLIASGQPLRPEARLERGAWVEIRHGALAGLRGQIIREASGQRFVVQVNFIQQGASVMLEDMALERIAEEGETQKAGR